MAQHAVAGAAVGADSALQRAAATHALGDGAEALASTRQAR